VCTPEQKGGGWVAVYNNSAGNVAALLLIAVADHVTVFFYQYGQTGSLEG
jgi:hypothetical protein